MNTKPDILVMGTGRSGTSYVAYILHEKLGVCMGYDFMPVRTRLDSSRPFGSYESTCMWNATIAIVGHRHKKKVDGPVDEWLSIWANKAHKKCGCKDSLKGVKVTHLARLTPKQLKAINPRLVIRTWRNKDDCVASYDEQHKYTTKKQDWEEFWLDREESMINLEIACKNIPFQWIVLPPKPKLLAENDIVAILQPWVERLKGG